MRPIPLLILLSLLLVMISVMGIAVGSVHVSLTDLWQLMLGQGEPMQRAVVLELRLPRVLSALAVGGMLALAGAQLQVLLGNPLADPYILGISGGAAVMALLAIVFGLGGLAIGGSAFVGALSSMLLVFGLAHGKGSWSPTRLLLTGVVIAAGWGALISFLLSVAPQQHLRSMLFWLMGDLQHSASPWGGLLVLVIGLALSLPLARSLNLLARGEMQAASLGVNVKRLRLQLYLLASLLTATAVTIGGSIGFVGLIIPHLMRLLIGSDHRLLLPAASLAGATLLVLADTLARTLLAPQQLPVGVLTAMLGVPVFLFLLQRNARSKAA
jgi:iron complex transport system permease protein